MANIVSQTNAANAPEFMYTGAAYDPITDTYQMGIRQEYSQDGRWWSQDPLGFAAGDTNLYGYVFNNPLNLRDPTGLDPFVQEKKGPEEPPEPGPRGWGASVNNYGGDIQGWVVVDGKTVWGVLTKGGLKVWRGGKIGWEILAKGTKWTWGHLVVGPVCKIAHVVGSVGKVHHPHWVKHPADHLPNPIRIGPQPQR